VAACFTSLSIVACENQPSRLDRSRQEAAFRAANLISTICRAKNRKVCDLATYYASALGTLYRQGGAAGLLCRAVRTSAACAGESGSQAREPDQAIAVFDLAVAGGRGYTTPPNGSTQGPVLSDQDALRFCQFLKPHGEPWTWQSAARAMNSPNCSPAGKPIERDRG